MSAHVALYDRLYGSQPNPDNLGLPEQSQGLSDVAALARCRGIRRLTVWPASLLAGHLTTAQRQRLGPAPFSDLDVLVTRTTAAAALHLLPVVRHATALDLHVANDKSEHQTDLVRAVAERMPRLRQLVLRFAGDFVLAYESLEALARSGTLTTLELRVGQDEGCFCPFLTLTLRQWQALLASLPLLERLWLPRLCRVVDGDALGVAGGLCRHLQKVHMRNVWDISALAAVPPVNFPNLRIAIVDSVGDRLPEEGYVSNPKTLSVPDLWS